MDRILVFDQGSIIEDGTYAKLLAQRGAYYRLWQMQAGGFLPEKDDSMEEGRGQKVEGKKYLN